MKPRPKLEMTWECRVARPGEWSQALGCWFGQLFHSDQLYSLYFQLEHEPGLAHGLWIARQEDEIDAVAWMIPGPGPFTHCWPLRCRLDLPEPQQLSVASELWKVVSAEYQSQGTRFFQVNVPVQHKLDSEQMQAIGFKEIARIQRHGLKIADSSSRVLVPFVHLEPIVQGQDLVFSRLMIESLTGSLDVPELNNYQSVEEVAAQYHKPGIERFFIQHIHRGIVGVLALQHDGEAGLIRYLGLVASERSQGWGFTALVQAIAYLESHGCDTVELRVDARNEPALSLYRGAGFQLVEEESMMIFI